MSAAVRFRSWAAVPIGALLLSAGCAVGAPVAEDDEFFEQNAEERSDGGELGALDAAMIDPSLIDPGPIDSGNFLPPFMGGASGATSGGTAGGTIPPRDAGAAGGRDASTSAPRDAGTTPPPATTTFDASAAAGCNALTCTNECSVAGPFPCCTLLDTCGCTWAPGAYCL
jgi:hypothetical protein